MTASINYDNSKVRRQDRLLNEDRAVQLLIKSEYGTLALIDEEGQPYAIPVNFVWDYKSSIYIHCAPEGKKLKSIEKHPNICFSIIGRVNLLSNKFTTEYESIILRAKARVKLTTEERMKALELLINKLSPNDKAIGMKYAEKSFHRTEIIRLDIISSSGKCKIVPNK